MVKFFDILDIATVQRLSASGHPLAYETVAVEGINTLIDAMRSYLSAGYDRNMALVNHDEHGKCTAFGIMEMLGSVGVMEFMAPKPDDEEMIETWADLAEAFVTHASEKGGQVVLAEVPAESNEHEALLRAGFSNLVHQQVSKLTKMLGNNNVACAATVREVEKSDDPAIKILTMRVVPKLLQRTDLDHDLSRMAHRSDRGFGVWQDQELVGHISFRHGRRGWGLQVLFRPDLDLDTVVMPALSFAIYQVLPSPNKGDKPVYCSLPSYQSWVQPALNVLGFGLVASNMLMAKNTTARVTQPVWSAQPSKVRGRRLAQSGENAVKSDGLTMTEINLTKPKDDEAN